MTADIDPEILTVEELADRLKVSRSTVFGWLKNNILIEGIHYLRIGRVLRCLWQFDLLLNISRCAGQSGITGKVPYSARHSFAAWSLTLGINYLRLVKLMGHASKQMIFEVYGNYVEGLEEDAEAIYRYFGADYLTPRKRKAPAPFGDSTGDSFKRSFVTT